jgi:hypothetical protein
MATTKEKKDKKASTGSLPKSKVDKNMTSHADDPFFIEKAKRGKELLDKYGLPAKDLK